MDKIRGVSPHIYVDLDAVLGACVELCRAGLEPDEKTVKFLPASAKLADISPGFLPVDIAAKKHGTGKSYVGNYLVGLLPKEVVNEVDQQDSQGWTLSQVPLSSVIAGLREAGKADLEIIQLFYPIVKGWMKIQQNREKAESEFRSLDKAQIGQYRFVITNGTESRQLGYWAMQSGIAGTIYWSPDGCGITRYPRSNVPDLAKLQLPGWYTHPNGFLFCWGARKSPAVMPPLQFKIIDEFLAWLDSQDVFHVKPPEGPY